MMLVRGLVHYIVPDVAYHFCLDLPERFFQPFFYPALYLVLQRIEMRYEISLRPFRYSALSDFLDVLEPPLQIHKPNKYKIISMDIPICRGDLCFCVDVLDALTKDFFARKGNPVEETAELGEVRTIFPLSNVIARYVLLPTCYFHFRSPRTRTAPATSPSPRRCGGRGRTTAPGSSSPRGAERWARRNPTRKRQVLCTEIR